MDQLHFGMPLMVKQYVNNILILDVLQSFDSEVTSLYYIEDKETLISASKGKSIKIWVMPKEWRDARLVADEKKIANKRLN